MTGQKLTVHTKAAKISRPASTTIIYNNPVVVICAHILIAVYVLIRLVKLNTEV
jgi:hypothetical protein